VFPHNHWVATDCPGTLDLERIVRGANLLNGYDTDPHPTPEQPDPTEPDPETPEEEPMPEQPDTEPEPERPTYTPPELPANVNPSNVAAALGAIIQSARARIFLYATVVLVGAGVWTTSEVVEAVTTAAAAGLPPIDVVLAGAKAGLGYLLPLLGGLALANVPKTTTE
jgi:hypothetical protein